MSTRDFLGELRAADRKVIECVRAEESAREVYATVQQTVTAGLPHAHDEDRRLQILNDARQHYARQRGETDRALEARAQVIDDRISDAVVRLVRATHPTIPGFAPHSLEVHT